MRTLMRFCTFIAGLAIAGFVTTPLYGQTSAQPVHLVSPKYPELARQAQIQGIVTVRIHVDQAGMPVNAEVTGGHNLLKLEVEQNIGKWRFLPGKAGDLELSFEFRLELPRVTYVPDADVSFDLPNKVVIVTHPMVPTEDIEVIRKGK